MLISGNKSKYLNFYEIEIRKVFKEVTRANLDIQAKTEPSHKIKGTVRSSATVTPASAHGHSITTTPAPTNIPARGGSIPTEPSSPIINSTQLHHYSTKFKVKSSCINLNHSNFSPCICTDRVSKSTLYILYRC